MLRQNLVFVAGWVLAGIAIAFVVNRLWREDRARPQAVAPAEAATPSAGPTMVSAHIDVPDAPPATPGPPATDADTQDSPLVGSPAAVRSSAPAVVTILSRRNVQVPGNPRLQRTPRGWQWVLPQEERDVLGSGVIVDAKDTS